MNGLKWVPMPLSAVVDGKTWKLFGVDFKTAEGTFSTYVYALCYEHAWHIVQELKASATLTNEVLGIYK